MRNRTRFLIIAGFIFLVSFTNTSFALEGSGTEVDPYLITSFEDFEEFQTNQGYWGEGVYTKLESDIDLGPELEGRQIYTAAPIAGDTDSDFLFDGTAYAGHFGGNGHVINNLTVEGVYYCGLFGKLDATSEINDLGLENVSVSGNGDDIGGLVGYSYFGSVINSYSTGSVHATGSFVGGLVGHNRSGSVTNSYSDVSVTATGSSVGGLMGYTYFGSVKYSYSAGSVNGNNSAGGLVGSNYSGSVTNSYSTGSVNAHSAVGGLVGFIEEGSVRNSYSAGSVTATGRESIVGGLVGYTYLGTVANSYSIGSVTATNSNGYLGSNVGGLVGYNRKSTVANSYSIGLVTATNSNSNVGGLVGYTYLGTATNCFWNVETSGIGLAGNDNFGAIGKTTELMQTLTTFTDANWDFTNETTNGTADIWRLCVDGTTYPRFAWEFGSDYSCPDGVSFEDLLYLSSNWLETSVDPYTSADRTGDGVVNLEDYSLLAEQWMKTE